MVKITCDFNRFHSVKALVIGDFMVDKYTYGKVSRISPEAPVGVLKVDKETYLPGGAGNVVLNFLSFSCDVVAIGRIGDDLEGERLQILLEEKGADSSILLKQKNYSTPVKNRVIAESQQIVRIDKEDILPIDKKLEEKIINILSNVIQGIDVIAISDYAKGFLSTNLLEKIIEIGIEKNVPIIVDPKGTDFTKYQFATIVKPNLSEAYLAANLGKNVPIEKVAKKLLDQTNAKTIIITRSQDGISYFDNKKACHFPIQSKEVVDVTGAGDTVLSIICIAIANNMDMSECCMLANIAAGIAIEHIGCAKITLSDLSKRLLQIDLGNKVFDENHLFALKHVLKEENFSILMLDSFEFNTNLYKHIRSISKKNKLVVYLDNEDEDFIECLSAFKEVDFIILHKKCLIDLCSKIRPKDVYYIKDNKLISEKNLLKNLIKDFSSV